MFEAVLGFVLVQFSVPTVRVRRKTKYFVGEDEETQKKESMRERKKRERNR